MRNLVALVVLAVLPLAAGAQKIVLVDRIVAVVAKEVITFSELNEAVAAAERQLRRQGTQAPPREVLERQMLERMVLDRAQLQMARDTGIRVDELQVDRAVQRVAESNKMTLVEFRQALERDRVPFDLWRQELREQILLSRLREREVDEKIQVSDTEVDLFLEDQRSRRGASAEYNVSHILVRVPEQASPERIQAARAKADKIIAEARAGGEFGRLAASYSEAFDALQGGTLGWRTHDRLPEAFAVVLERMKPGEVSDVVRSAAGMHVLRLNDRRGATAVAGVQQTRLRHILIRVSETVSEADARRRLTDLRSRITAGRADFGEVARAQSDDATAARGGELDWVYPGDTVPEFERALQGLALGEVSEPVRTPFGFHLIQVLERRSADLSSERQRLVARQALRERKADEAYQEWLRQLRDQVYVELRLDER
ncbi:MAG TPA: peptidylprolyl isomerase [Burkholderiales bacterium]